MTIKTRQSFRLECCAQPPDVALWGQAQTPYGTVLAAAREDGAIGRLTVLDPQTKNQALDRWKKTWPHTRFLQAQEDLAHLLERAFKARPSGRLSGLSLLLVGTPFQHKVWQALLSVPHGQVVTYGELAQRIGQPKAARAVGGALNANPVAILVPCHRVVSGRGVLGGFALGQACKKRLLSVENIGIFEE